jgi:hypothetical protein
MANMLDFNALVAKTRPLIDPNLPDIRQIQFNNWAKRQNAMAQVPQDEDWQAEQRNTMFMDGYRPNSSFTPAPTSETPHGYDRSSGVGMTPIPEPEPEPGPESDEDSAPAPGQEQGAGNMIAAINGELKGADDGSWQYAMGVLRRLPEVFAKYENADPSRAMPYFLAGQQGRQRETEMARMNDFTR